MGAVAGRVGSPSMNGSKHKNVDGGETAMEHKESNRERNNDSVSVQIIRPVYVGAKEVPKTEEEMLTEEERNEVIDQWTGSKKTSNTRNTKKDEERTQS